MYSLRYRIARWVLSHRKLAWAVFILITAFFAAGLPKVQLRTIFSDLLPSNDPFVQVFQDHPGFGSPLSVAVMIKRKDGSKQEVKVLLRIDTPIEVDYYVHGGILPYVLRELLAAA